jgi:pimeloyl-ACP methyl ester carboxylesterase
MPAVFVHGLPDTPRVWDVGKEWGARLVSLPACSHWWQLQEPNAVASELQRWWAELDAA